MLLDSDSIAMESRPTLTCSFPLAATDAGRVPENGSSMNKHHCLSSQNPRMCMRPKKKSRWPNIGSRKFIPQANNIFLQYSPLRNLWFSEMLPNSHIPLGFRVPLSVPRQSLWHYHEKRWSDMEIKFLQCRLCDRFIFRLTSSPLEHFRLQMYHPAGCAHWSRILPYSSSVYYSVLSCSVENMKYTIATNSPYSLSWFALMPINARRRHGDGT